MEKVTLTVKGMSCGHCVKSIEGSVGELNGVQHVEVNLNEAKVSVEFDQNKVSLESIKEAIDDQGYEVA
ncbi:copper chaperone CopZ (plasmid) [Priestia megaterium]|uniref:copper chaperone CopZ n=1 Tax=Priestia TaxID=2800373 RepID=UPI002220C407|nr:copper chaperone CopZ [Priestia sp. JV24]MCW1048986.1 copper chaperone CopZ [Priestia sp. JV24]